MYPTTHFTTHTLYLLPAGSYSCIVKSMIPPLPRRCGCWGVYIKDRGYMWHRASLNLHSLYCCTLCYNMSLVNPLTKPYLTFLEWRIVGCHTTIFTYSILVTISFQLFSALIFTLKPILKNQRAPRMILIADVDGPTASCSMWPTSLFTDIFLPGLLWILDDSIKSPRNRSCESGNGWECMDKVGAGSMNGSLYFFTNQGTLYFCSQW